MPLAACQGTSTLDQVLGIGIALAVVAFWTGLAWFVVWLEREPEERRALLLILFLAGCAAALTLAVPHGTDLTTLLLPALTAVLAVGAGGGLLLRVGIPRGVGAALTGGLFLPLAVLVVVLASTYLGGSCLGEELG